MAIADMIGESLAGSRAAAEFAETAQRLRRSTVSVSILTEHGREAGGGSGVIWRSDGLIVTNAHVARADRARVELWDGRTFAARVTARHARRDLATLTIDAADLPAIQPGDSDRLRVGELVLAVGNPLGVAGAMTAGIVHTIGPADGHGRQSWVQADVRLAPGNSGGPLADAHGRVIGINAMINGGLALAVPSNAVERFLRRGERPYLGVTMQPVEVPLVGARVPGLLLVGVAAGGPADAAGLMVGDVLIGAGGKRFGHPGDLGEALDDAGIGATLHLDIVRAGRQTNRGVTLTRKGEATAERDEVDAA